VCKQGDQTTCDCFDPVRWTGDRCEISVCGTNGLVIVENWTPIAGDWTSSDKYWPTGVCWEYTFAWMQQACYHGCGDCVLSATGRNGTILCGCAPGWSGAPACNYAMDCVWGKFLNSEPPKCVCQPGYSGPACDIPFPEPIQVCV
jgi:hypothetical protein